MLALGNQDVRKRLGVNDYGGKREMMDLELEEGEAYLYHNGKTNDEYDDCVDPDVSLSYIDEKLQLVLGHLQKDFEGVVSAENLGPKYGIYGSFLENGERSPICGTPRSATSSRVENGGHYPMTPLSVPPMIKPRSAPVHCLAPSGKLAHAGDLAKQGGLPPLRTVEHVNNNERDGIRSIKLPDLRKLKVRIKVGSDNLLKQKKAAYCGLGLDISPSTSVDCSPSESEVLESPMSILQIMISSPVHETLLQSPLREELIHFTVREPLLEHRKDSSSAGANGLVPLREKQKVVDRKASDSKEKIDEVTDLKSAYGRTSLPGTSGSSKKTLEMDTMDCEEVVSNTLKLPMISGSGRMVNLMGHPPNDAGKDKTLNGPGKVGTPESPLNEDLGISGKPKGYLGKLLQDKKAKLDGTPRKNDNYQGETCIESEIHHSNFADGNSAKTAECHAAIPTDDLTRKVKIPSRGKAKFKGSRNDESFVADASRESLSGSSSATKRNKSVQLESSWPNSGHDYVKSKGSGQSRNVYKEFFGDFDGEEDNLDTLEEVPTDAVKDIIGAQKGLLVGNGKMVKSSRKKIIKPLKSTTNAPVGQISELGNKHDVAAITISSAATVASAVPLNPAAPEAPVFVEDWVGCDKCEKWRLLPPGKDPDDLPDKWVCSMLDWLPGLNRCSISEDETNAAVLALLQSPLPVFQKTKNLNGGVLGRDIDALRQSEVKQSYLGPPPLSSRGKKNPGKNRMSFPNKEGSQFSDSEKKPVLSDKSRSLDDVKPFPSRNEASLEKPIKHESIGEKRGRDEKTIEDNSDGGNLRSSKSHKRIGDNVKSLKMKVKKEPRQHDNEGWRYDDSITSRRIVEHTTGREPSLMGKNLELDEEAYVKTAKQDSATWLQVSVKNPIGKGCVSLDVGGSKERHVVGKKMKLKNPEEALQCVEGTTGNHRESGVFVRDNENRKAKKQKMLNHEGKAPGFGKASSKIDKGGCEPIDQRQGLGNQPSRWGISAMDSIQRKIRSPMPVAAASSSSKVCSSPKSKSSFKETKGSPTESVSSSPIRCSKRDQHNLVPRNPVEKEEVSQFVKISSPRKYPDENISGLASHFWTRRQEDCTDVHYGSLGSSLAPNPDENGFSVSTKSKVRLSLDALRHKGRKDSRDALGPNKTADSDHCLTIGQSEDSHHGTESHSQMSGKGSSARSKDGTQSLKQEGERDKLNNSLIKSKEAMPLKEVKGRIQETVHDDSERNCSSVQLGGKHGKVSQSHANRQESNDEDLDAPCGQNTVSSMDNNGKKFSIKPRPSKTDQSAGKGPSLPSSLPGMIDSSGTNIENEAELITQDAFEGDTLKFPGKLGGIDATIRRQRQATSNGNCSQETDARSPIRKDSSNQDANKVIKEGADLKHMADRLKNTDSSLGRTELYFQAVLKFLSGASLLESSKMDGSKQNDTMLSSTQVYASTAKLCEYCAHEYEKCKDVASAALAYKCMEVAYMKVVYSSSNTAGRDRVDLQKTFKINPAGESPSSSVSDLDNVNNSAAMEKSAPKCGRSPNVSQSQSIIAQNREQLIRLFNFSHNVTNAMEASRRSHIAFTAASARAGDTHYVEGISCIRRALDFNFHDVQGLVGLVRLASETINQ
ncbi:hypothetical protein MLD38_026393 [Melastoma candidum]|uniref:Uncharacterized protein n=1 Tax=Melastoma candidum TaxID=119954 RepID=A0ACB9NZC5_9MYRT|nr:hypothetical protein MLD38_026393 [Melastoma candidum]